MAKPKGIFDDDPKYQKLKKIRESGYTGPLDQDLNKDTTSEAAGILRRMAQRRGEIVDW